MRAANDKRHVIAKRGANAPQLLPYEKILAEGLKDFLQELAMVNGGVIVTYICNSQHANLGDIIGSSLECAIKPGRLRYANDALVDFDWGQVPQVTLGMELCDDRLRAGFRVVFGGSYVGVDIRRILFSESPAIPGEKLRRFAEVVADARLPAPGRTAQIGGHA
jgi:hypothetical protein